MTILLGDIVASLLKRIGYTPQTWQYRDRILGAGMACVHYRPVKRPDLPRPPKCGCDRRRRRLNRLLAGRSDEPAA